MITKRDTGSGWWLLGAAAVVAVCALPSNGALILTTADTRGADAGIDFINQSTNAGTANAVNLRVNASTNQAAYLAFGLPDFTGGTSGASLSFTKTGSNSTSVNVYGLVDGHPGENWSESVITYANAPGVDTASSSAAGIALLDSDTVLLGTISFGTGQLVLSLSGSALENFLSADTDGRVTIIVKGTADRGAFLRTKEWTAGAPALSLPSASIVIPEPTSLSCLAVAVAGLVRRRRT